MGIVGVGGGVGGTNEYLSDCPGFIASGFSILKSWNTACGYMINLVKCFSES